MAAADSYTIQEKGISGQELMERAGEALLKEVLRRKPQAKKITVLCGKGNNGGDGFVIARRAAEAGLDVSVLIFADKEKIKDDARLALERCLKSGAKILELDHLENALSSTDCVIDALYGIKFKGALLGIEADIVQAVLHQRKTRQIFVVAVDLPSGSICNTGAVNGPCFDCDLTVSFQAFKPAHFCFPAAKFCGERVVVDIGIETKTFTTSRLISAQSFTASPLAPASLLMPASGFKGTRGHMIVVAGSPGHSGAAALTARAGLRAGAGLVTLYSDSESCKIAVEYTPEIMTKEATELEIQKIGSITRGSLVIGPGLSPNSSMFNPALSAASNLAKVIDASALRILALEQTKPNLDNAILTPHPGEMAALLGATTEEVLSDRFGCVKKCAGKFNCTVVLKGAYTLIAFPDEQLRVSPFASANLGTAGSGDVLSGLIGGLLARGLSIKMASALGVYLHGLVGSTLLPNGVVGSLASEFADGFPQALSDLVLGKILQSSNVFPASN